MYSVVDLFSGAGGLSLGFAQTHAFDIKVAFENNPDMQQTYRLNHPGVDLQGDVCKADYVEIRNKYGSIDVVIGGPPCQGFSNANRQRNHLISHNNLLVKQFIRAVTELHPKAFVMENVSMLRSEVHRIYLSKKDLALVKRFNIPSKESEIFLAEEEYLQDGIIDILQNPEELRKYIWISKYYRELNIVFKATKHPQKLLKTLQKHKQNILRIVNEMTTKHKSIQILKASEDVWEALREYYSKGIDEEQLRTKLEKAIMLQRMFMRALEVHDNDLVIGQFSVRNGLVVTVNSCAITDYLHCVLASEEYGYLITSKVLNAADFGAPQKRKRFVILGVKKSITNKIALPNGRFDEEQYRTVYEAIGDLENVEPIVDINNDKGLELAPIRELNELGKMLRNNSLLMNHVIPKTTKNALDRFKTLKQGENFHSLVEELKTNTYTDSSRTQNTIYLRLDYCEPSGTVINVRKSMWIHPVRDRALSIREAARLQTFPDSFIFCGTKDKQYQQVGNAVPPLMAKSIADKLACILRKTDGICEEDC